MDSGPNWSKAKRRPGNLLVTCSIRSGRLDAPDDALHLYRADEIAEPGQITQQIKDSIAGAHLTIADVTNMNPNVCGTSGTPTAWDGPSPS
jgi:hypothetical protein